MPIALKIETTDHARPWLSRIHASLDSQAVKQVIGRAGANKVRSHLFTLDSRRANKTGGKRTHFYASAARSVHYNTRPNGVVISINKRGIAQRYFGGTITPRQSKALTIPAHPNAYGRRAREIPNLHIISFKKSRKAKGALADKNDTIYYWLVKSVTQKPDHSVLPTDRELRDAALQAADNYIDRIRKRGK